MAQEATDNERVVAAERIADELRRDPRLAQAVLERLLPSLGDVVVATAAKEHRPVLRRVLLDNLRAVLKDAMGAVRNEGLRDRLAEMDKAFGRLAHVPGRVPPKGWHIASLFRVAPGRWFVQAWLYSGRKGPESFAEGGVTFEREMAGEVDADRLVQSFWGWDRGEEFLHNIIAQHLLVEQAPTAAQAAPMESE